MQKFYERENNPEEIGIYNFSINNTSDDNIVSSLEQRKVLEEINAKNSLLPIGSVISKEDKDEKYMIVGHLYDNYDYVLCKYPEGIKKDEQLIGISKNEVVRIYRVGYIDEQEKKNREEMLNKIR